MHKDADVGDKSYYAELGLLLVTWNRTENILREILIGMCGPSPEIWILTAELGGVSLENALKSSATDIAPLRVKGHIEHCAEWFSRLREFRNYFIHGITSVGYGKDLVHAGVISQTSAKTRLVLHTEVIAVERIKALIESVRSLHDFAAYLLLHTLSRSRETFPGGTPFPPLPEMPPLPDRLQKPRRYLTDDPPQPSSSRAK